MSRIIEQMPLVIDEHCLRMQLRDNKNKSGCSTGGTKCKATGTGMVSDRAYTVTGISLIVSGKSGI